MNYLTKTEEIHKEHTSICRYKATIPFATPSDNWPALPNGFAVISTEHTIVQVSVMGYQSTAVYHSNGPLINTKPMFTCFSIEEAEEVLREMIRCFSEEYVPLPSEN